MTARRRRQACCPRRRRDLCLRARGASAPTHQGPTMRPTTIFSPAPAAAPALSADQERMLPPRPRQFLERLVRLGLLDGAQRDSFLVGRLERLRDYATEERLGN